MLRDIDGLGRQALLLPLVCLNVSGFQLLNKKGCVEQGIAQAIV